VKVIQDVALSDETTATYIESRQPFDFELGIWRPLRRLEEWQDNSLLPGKYEVELTFYDPDLTQGSNRIFVMQIVDKNGVQVAGRKVDLYNESKLDNKPVRMRITFSAEQGQKLYLRFIPKKGSIILNSLVIHPVE
jgi:hypothetical protein